MTNVAISFARASRNGAMLSPMAVRKFVHAELSCANPLPATSDMSPAFDSKSALFFMTALTSAALRSVSDNALAVFPMLAAYSSFARAASTVMPRLSRISGDWRPRPVTMSLKACVTDKPIALPRTAAICNSCDISSAEFATPSNMARLAASIRSVSLIMPADALRNPSNKFRALSAPPATCSKLPLSARDCAPS